MPELYADPGSDSGPTSTDPGGMPSENLLEGPYAPSTPQGQQSYSTPGPRRQPGIASKTSAAPSIFDSYSGPQVDAAKSIMKGYMALLGWPQSVDTNQMALELLKNNLENKPQEAFEHFWQSSFLTDDMRKANPWARFGKDADSFHQELATTQDAIHKLTGLNVPLEEMLASISKDIKGSDPMQEFLQSAIKGSWSQGQMMDFLQSGSFTDLSGQKVDLTQITSAQPWLASGQTYQQQAQQYHTIYGAAPVDTNQLASWYKFNQSAATMGPWYARQAVTSSPGKMPTAVGQSEVR